MSFVTKMVSNETVVRKVVGGHLENENGIETLDLSEGLHFKFVGKPVVYSACSPEGCR